MTRGHDFDTMSGRPPGRVPTDPRSAPPDLEQLRTFLNSDNRYYGVDVLQDEERRAGWFTRWLPTFDVADVDDRGWARLVELRDAVRALVAAEPGAAERLSTVAAAHPVHVAFLGEGSSVSARLSASAARPEQPIAAAVLGLLQLAVHDGRFTRFGLCERPECGWCYYDGSKNRSARWCSSDPCGDVMKARAYRSRHAADG